MQEDSSMMTIVAAEWRDRVQVPSRSRYKQTMIMMGWLDADLCYCTYCGPLLLDCKRLLLPADLSYCTVDIAKDRCHSIPLSDQDGARSRARY